MNKIPVGVSACLMGDAVRYNGENNLSRFCRDAANYFDFHKYCPEVAIGMGVPREPIRLVGDVAQPRAVGVRDATVDVTEALTAYGQQVGEESRAALSGFILTEKSPSCGLYTTKLYDQRGELRPDRVAGLFTRALTSANPLLPMEESDRLNDPLLSENFLTRVYAYHDWRTSVTSEPSAQRLVQFHSRYKYMSMAYSPTVYRELGRRVAQVSEADATTRCDAYIACFMAATATPATRQGHSNVLYHLLGYLKKTAPGSVRREIVDAIEGYREGRTRRAVPLALLSTQLTRYGSDYVRAQAYLKPYPAEFDGADLPG